MLNEQQRQRAVEALKDFLTAPKRPDGLTPTEFSVKLDADRRALIATQLKPLIEQFLAGQVDLPSFKTRIDSLNKRHEYWGFKGIKGQMFFNQLVNANSDLNELAQELRAVFPPPSSIDIAKSRLNSFISYVKRVGDDFVEGGGSKHGRPKPSSAPFFVSYFWQIQDPDRWPVYYTNSVQVLNALNLWSETGDHGQDYASYCEVQFELGKLFTEHAGRRFDLYGVEHVLWFKGGSPFSGTATESPVELEPMVEATAPEVPVDRSSFESYVPPIVAILPQLARNDPGAVAAAAASGASVDRAFEKCINAAFTILGYDTRLLGQGSGRVPDGIARNDDDSYAIIWDAKVRMRGYGMGTDDRAIREYIKTQGKELKKRKALRNVYYAIISSIFVDDFDDDIRAIKMETDINEVCLIEASALVGLVEQRMRAPREVSLGPDGIQHFFAASGIINAEMVAGHFS